MRRGLDVLRDPSFHLLAVSALLLGAFLVLTSGPRTSSSASTVQHPAQCHACSACPPEVAAARDEFLIRTGSIQAPDSSE